MFIARNKCLVYTQFNVGFFVLWPAVCCTPRNALPRQVHSTEQHLHNVSNEWTLNDYIFCTFVCLFLCIVLQIFFLEDALPIKSLTVQPEQEYKIPSTNIYLNEAGNFLFVSNLKLIKLLLCSKNDFIHCKLQSDILCTSYAHSFIY